MMLDSLPRAQKLEAQRRLNREKADRRRLLKSPCPFCLLERNPTPKHLLPQQTCVKHNHTDPRPFLRPDRSWLKKMIQAANKNHNQG